MTSENRNQKQKTLSNGISQIANGGIHLGINYLVSNEMKQDK
jgi:hypothetical protein